MSPCPATLWERGAFILLQERCGALDIIKALRRMWGLASCTSPIQDDVLDADCLARRDVPVLALHGGCFRRNCAALHFPRVFTWMLCMGDAH